MNKSNNIFIVDIILSAKKSFNYLLSKWLLILFLGIIAGSLGILYAWLKKPVYTAEIIFSSEAAGDNALGGYAGIAAQFGFDLGGGSGGAFEGDNLMELLKSKSMIEKTLLSDAKNFGSGKLMIDAYIQNHELKKDWDKKPSLNNIVFERNPPAPVRSRDSILLAVTKEIIESQLFVGKLDKKLNYIVVTMKDDNEVFAKDFSEMLLQNASDFYISYKSKKAKKNFDLIYKMTDSIKGLLYGNLESYAVSNDLNVNPLRQQVKTGSQKIQVNAQANTALYTELLKQMGLSQITLQKETPLIQIIDKPMLPLKKTKPGRLLTGITFAFFIGIITCGILLIRRLIRDEFKVVQQNAYRDTLDLK
ncbi:MAG TPA: hypothetical protein VF623_07850 [Segetibacter sp.]|jgi:hypothetical protein